MCSHPPNSLEYALETWLIAIVALPFLAALLAPLVIGARVPNPGLILALAPLASLGICLAAGRELIATGQPLTWTLNWVPSFGVSLSFYFDGLAMSFVALISFIGVLIVIYAGAYLKGHEYLARFYCFLLLFMGAMLGVVVAGDLITLFVFWELTSITSYLLIGFNHRDAESRANALQALLVTGGGGLALLAGVVLLGHVAGSYDYADLFVAAPEIIAHPLASVCLVLILLGAFTKSAQFPFHFWLPNAMAAPAPVSAYLHSSTMVKAGVYLLARMVPVFAEHAWWAPTLLVVGGLTAAVSAYLALRQTKMKPLLAYTTISALGMLVAFIGIGTPEALKAMLVFLFVHAFYKASLFMVAGALEHETGEKDVEKLGGLARLMPWTAGAAALAALSMAGVPPLLGFIGKEVLYESALGSLGDSRFQPWFLAFLIALVAANGANVFVALMMAWRPFWAKSKASQDGQAVHEGSPGLWLGPVVLASLGLILGLYSAPLSNNFLLTGLRSFLPDTETLYLTMWHGFNAALLLSIVTLGAGLTLYGFREKVRPALLKLAVLDRFGSLRAYEQSIKAMLWVSITQTRIIQNGYLRTYLFVTACALIGLAGLMLVFYAGLPPLRYDTPVDLYGVVLSISIAIGALSVVRTQSRLAAVAYLGVVGFGISLIYVLYSAPDLAMTQFIIETITVVLFILVLRRLPRFSVFSNNWLKVRDAVVAGSAGLLMAMLVLTAVDVDLAPRMSGYYEEQSVPGAHGRNIVNTILVDFRALDTLGELGVLSVAALGAYGLLRLRKPEDENP